MPKTKTKTTYPEIDDIRDDLDSLKSNVVELTKHVKHDGEIQTRKMQDALKTRLQEMRISGRKQYQKVEKQVKAKPAQSMAIAFAAGVAASMLMRRR